MHPAISDLAVSPDGRRVAYASGPTAIEKDRRPSSQLWLTSAEGGPARRLTSGAYDRLVSWSPDGRRLAFLSDRGGLPQVHLLDLERGGDALQLTDQPGPVLAYRWSPEGSLIAFIAVDGGSCEAERGEQGDEIIAVQPGNFAGLWVVDVPADATPLEADAPASSRRLSPEDVHILPESLGGSPFDWTPDGRSLIATTAASSAIADQMFAGLIAVDLDGSVRRIASFVGRAATPAVSRDGSTIVLTACEGGQMRAFYSLHTVPVAGGELRPVTPGFDGSFFGFDWLPDGDLLALAQIHQEQLLVIVDPGTGATRDAIQPFDEPGAVDTFSVSLDGRHIAFVRGDDHSFGDLFHADVGGAARRLTDLNPWTRTQDFGEVRELSWPSVDGYEIEGLLRLPAGYEEGTRCPLLLQIHGGPSEAWVHHLSPDDAFDWARTLAQKGYATLSPNPRGSSGRGTDFLRAAVDCYGEPDFEDLMAGVDKVVELGIADPERLVVGGWSGGGFLTNWAITHTNRFKAAVSGSGMSNWVSLQGTSDSRMPFFYGPLEVDPDKHWRYSPIRYIKSATTPTLILFGDDDTRVPPSQGRELYEGLRAIGVETQFVRYPREGHSILERGHQLDVVRRVVDWFDTHLERS